MPTSLIHNIDRRSGRVVAAAADQAVLLSSAALGWGAMTAELHGLAPEHQPEHLVQTHRLMAHVGAPARFEFREDGGRWQSRDLRAGDLSSRAEPRRTRPPRRTPPPLPLFFLQGFKR